MARSQPAIWITVALMLAVAATGSAPGLAQQPLPTPRGQLGGREPLDPTWQAGIVVPTPPTPSAGMPADDTASLETERLASMAAVAARSTVVVRAWRGNDSSGSAGWVWDASGRVVTATGNVENAGRIEVAAADGAWVVAALLGADPETGVAVLAAPELDAPPLDLPPARVRPGGVVAAVSPTIERSRDLALTVGTAGSIEPGTVAFVEVIGGAGSWTPGAPVVAESGLVGMALSATDPQARATPPGEAEPGSANATSTGATAAYVPIETMRDEVSALTK